MARARRILFLSNFYPPAHKGGYEIFCRAVVEELARRGHETRVLTSSHQPDAGGDRICRLLTAHGPHVGVVSAKSENERLADDARTLGGVIAEFRPEALSLWNLDLLPKGLLGFCYRLALPVVLHLSDRWLRFHQGWSHQERGAPGADALAPAACYAPRPGEPGRFDRFEPTVAHFPSRFMRDFYHALLLRAGHEIIIPYGVEDRFDGFASRPPRADRGAPWRLLYTGRLTWEKGLHTVTRAMGEMARRGRRDFLLTVLTLHGEPDYRREVEAEIAALGIGDRVTFAPGVMHEAMPLVYARHDVALLPSIVREAWPLTILEAFAAGTVVACTPTGGSAEMVEAERTALVFPPDDHRALADGLASLPADPARARRMAAAAHEEYRARFTFARTFGAIADLYEDEAVLARAAERPASV
ncbi:MAG: glycosyltransferase family 4 protein [Planctomycetes bacterium]|nr:glycosyltransferase family 4 protein [Planctomycetota bacterium]